VTDHIATLAEVLRRSQQYLDLASRVKDHGERELYKRIVELYLKIAGELESISDRQNTASH